MLNLTLALPLPVRGSERDRNSSSTELPTGFYLLEKEITELLLDNKQCACNLDSSERNERPRGI